MSDTPGAGQQSQRAGRPLQLSGMEPARARATGGMVYGPHARYSPTAGPPTGSQPDRTSAQRPPAPEAVTQTNFAALMRGWMRTLTPTSWQPVHDVGHPLVLRTKRWAPVVAPAVIGSLLLTLTLALRAHLHAPASLVPATAVTPTLLVVYLLGGVLLGLALYFAPNGVVWSLAFFAGPPLLLAALLTVAFGPTGGLLVLSLLAALLLIYSAWRRSITAAGTVEVTLLLGEWYRTLQPGYNILLPGERIITTLRTRPRAFTTATQRIALTPNRIAQARATVSYLVNPQEAWRTASVRATWEDELRQRISDSVRESLYDWRDAPGGDMTSRGSIARRALEDTRGWARSVGVRILSVRAHDIAIGSPDELQPPQPADTSGQRATPRVERAPATPRVMSSAAFIPPSAPPFEDPLDEDDEEAAPAPAPAVAERGRIPAQARVVARPASAAERPSPAALEDLYEAVRNRQITDTQVIREIAGHFAVLTREPLAPGALPFDPAAAAQLLGEYADALDAAQPATRQRVRRR